jgi:iron complex outermembrane receptor protein
MRLTDELHFDPVNFVNYNLDPTRRRGVETIASWQVMRDVRLSGNLTYTDAVFREGPFAGNQVPLVSRWTGNVGVSWDIVENWLTLDTIVQYVGSRRMDNDQRNFQPLIPEHTTVDVRLGGEVEQFFWSAGVANLFDVHYFDYSIASATTFNTFNVYPQPGRTYMVKAGTTW